MVLSLSLIFSIFINSLFVEKEICIDKQKTFVSGEELYYTISYNLGPLWVNAADVTFTANLEEYKGNICWHFKGKGQTFPGYDWIFKVRDLYESFVDTSYFRPLKYVRDTKEGSNIKYNENYFNNYKNVAYSFTRNEKGKMIKDTARITSCTYDVLTMIYAARNINFSKYKAGSKIPISLYLDGETYSQYIEYLGKETIKTELGNFDCIKFKPKLIAGTIFKAGDEMTVWATDDKNKIPLVVETPILVGSIKAKINTVKNLRYPLHAIQKK